MLLGNTTNMQGCSRALLLDMYYGRHVLLQDESQDLEIVFVRHCPASYIYAGQVYTALSFLIIDSDGSRSYCSITSSHEYQSELLQILERWRSVTWLKLDSVPSSLSPLTLPVYLTLIFVPTLSLEPPSPPRSLVYNACFHLWTTCPLNRSVLHSHWSRTGRSKVCWAQQQQTTRSYLAR